jgi:hypothetical protein
MAPMEVLVSYKDKNGRRCTSFSKERSDKYDQFGRDVSKEFLEQLNYSVEMLGSRSRDPQPDIQATKGKKTVYVDAEVKQVKNWKYIKEGLDIPCRKEKFITNFPPFAHLMVCSDGEELIWTKPSVLQETLLCVGYKDAVNFNEKSDHFTENFCKSPNGIYIVYKSCFCPMSKRSDDNHFIRIPYTLLKHYRKQNDLWRKVCDH